MLGVVAFGSLLTAATSSVINVALPDMARDFGVDPSGAAWFVLAFLLAVTALLLAAGRLGDVLGHGRVYLAGFVVFGLGAAGCALAPSAGALVVARVVQGIGSAAVMATSPALSTLAVPPERRGFALGLVSTSIYLGLTVGPPLGGHAVGALGWRSIFWITLAASAAVVALAARVSPPARVAKRDGKLDAGGALLTAVGTLAFLLVATRGPSWGLRHPATLVSAAVAVATLPPFVWVELRHAAPTLDLRLFRSPVFSAAALSALLNYVSLFVAIYVLPFAMRDGQAMSPRQVGTVLSAQAVAMTLLAWGSGSLSDRIGSRGLATGGMLVLGAGMAGLAWSWPSSGMLVPAAWLFVCGAGTGVFVSPNSSALMGAAPRERQGIAGGVLGLARNLGMSVGVGIGAGLYASAFARSPGHGAWSPAADAAVRTGLGVSAVLAIVAAAVAWVARGSGPRKPPAPGEWVGRG
jgi:EmrB/QacA subfamily drug resistance transporter